MLLTDSAVETATTTNERTMTNERRTNNQRQLSPTAVTVHTPRPPCTTITMAFFPPQMSAGVWAINWTSGVRYRAACSTAKYKQKRQTSVWQVYTKSCEWFTVRLCAKVLFPRKLRPAMDEEGSSSDRGQHRGIKPSAGDGCNCSDGAFTVHMSPLVVLIGRFCFAESQSLSSAMTVKLTKIPLYLTVSQRSTFVGVVKENLIIHFAG